MSFNILLSKGGNSKGVSTSTALRRIREAYFDNEIIRTGHTHWDSKQEFSGHDARFLAGSGNNIKTVLDKKEVDGKFNKHKFMISVSTSNGSYRTMKYSYAKNTLNDYTSSGTLHNDVIINTELANIWVNR